MQTANTQTPETGKPKLTNEEKRKLIVAKQLAAARKMAMLEQQMLVLRKRDTAAERKLQTRQNIIVGALLRENNPQNFAQIANMAKRACDRAAFDLPPLEVTQEVQEVQLAHAAGPMPLRRAYPYQQRLDEDE